MKYVQPYGVSDPEASYINGNPATGTMGSIPPAASIEHPQREIVNFIKDARLTPDVADMHQLGKAVQGGQVIYADDAGTVNQLVITVAPDFGALVKGMVFITKILHENTGASTLKVNSLPPVPIVHPFDDSEMVAGELTVGSLQAFGFDGTNFQRVWAQSAGGSGGGPMYLKAPATFYVNGTTGSDTLYDGTAAAAVAGTIHGPYKTIQKACDQIPFYNVNGYTITINVANGNYAPFYLPPQNGSGKILVNGNASTPASCAIVGVSSSCILSATGARCEMQGFKVSNSGTPPAGGGDPMVGVGATGGETILLLGNMEFGQCWGAQLAASRGALVGNLAAGCVWKISGGSTSAGQFSGFMYASYSGSIGSSAAGGPAIQIVTPISYAGAFALAAASATLSMLYGSLTGAANVTGRRYWAWGLGGIGTAGGGANYYPGTIAGIVESGGVYS